LAGYLSRDFLYKILKMSISRLPSAESNGGSEANAESFAFLLRHKGFIRSRIIRDPVWFQYHGENPDNIEDLVSDAIAFMVPHIPGYDAQFRPTTYINVLLRRFRSRLSRQQAYAHTLFMGHRGKGTCIMGFVRDHVDLVLQALASSEGDSVSITWAPKVGKNTGIARTETFDRAVLEEALSLRTAAHRSAKGHLSVSLDQPFGDAELPLSGVLPGKEPAPDEGAIEANRREILGRVVAELAHLCGNLPRRRTRRAILERRIVPLANGSGIMPPRSQLSEELSIAKQAVDAAEGRVLRDIREALHAMGIGEEDI